ncbi:hypothetical protein AVEN_7563-1 [Araneus ventricosus]|uniref:Uncharacterized protein n=1 Tax=Araneus ventricosus TaxID=182803 RepID=A0A4Y2TCC7_ARAVE|nr:hypothetical protein AVEN_7563-1 [Araneus ventricosus]
MPFPQEESRQVSDSAFQSSKLVEEIARKFENLPFLQKHFPFITYARIVPISEAKMDSEATFDKELLRKTRFTKEAIVNDLSSCGRNPDELFRKESSLNEQVIEILPNGQSENLSKDDSFNNWTNRN